MKKPVTDMAAPESGRPAVTGGDKSQQLQSAINILQYAINVNN